VNSPGGESQRSIAQARAALESDWKSGKTPRLEEALSTVPAFEQEVALYEFLRLEIVYRQQRAENCDIADYLKRFPAFEQTVHRAFADSRNLSASAEPNDSADGEEVNYDTISVRPTAETKREASSDDDLPQTLTFFGSTRPETEQFATVVTGDSGEQSPAQTGRAPSSSASRFVRLREHARGGLGKVFVARDTELGREVALKEILPRYVNDHNSRSRFIIEAEVTGGLEHPCIVPVYGLGTYADGSPYYAMRFIRGTSLKEEIDKYHHRLRTADFKTGEEVVEMRQLLTRFISVCQAIDYAHSRGVLHRDIKPGNIMLGKYGETFVVDWGLAKAQGTADEPTTPDQEAALHPASGSDLPPTLMGSMVGTLQYMSPEQVLGRMDIIGPPADVFSLGATLYHLLTGKLIYQHVPKEKLIQHVEQADIRPLRQLRGDLPKALEAICHKAMMREPADRYQVAGELIRDLELFLADEPVAAYQETRFEKLARFVRRHRQYVIAGFGALSMIVVISLAAAFVSNRAWRREAAAHKTADEARQLEKQAREIATENYQVARDAVDRWLTGATETLRYYPSFQQMRANLLKEAVADYEKFVQFKSDDPTLELERGRAWMRLGDAHSSLGDPGLAVQAWSEAVAIFAEQLQHELADKKTLTREQLAAVVRQGEGNYALGNIPLAQEKFSAAQEMIAQLGDSKNWDEQTISTVGNLFLHQATLELNLAQREKARKALERAAEILLGSSAGPTAQISTEEIRLTLLRMQARLALEDGEFPVALAALQSVTKRIADLLPAHPADAVRILDWGAAAQVDLGLIYRRLGDNRAEINSYMEAEKYYQELSQRIPDAVIFQEMLALTQNDRAYVHWDLEELAAGEQAAESAAKIFRRLANGQPATIRYRDELAAATDLTARFQADRGEADPAEAKFKEAIELLSALSDEVPEAPDYRKRCAISRYIYAQLLAQNQRHSDAAREFAAAVADLQEVIELAPEEALLQQALGYVYAEYAWWSLDQKMDADAEEQFAAAKAAWKRSVEISPAPELKSGYARFLLERADEEALKFAQEAYLATPSSPEFQWTYGWALCAAGDEKTWLELVQKQKLPQPAPPLGRIRDCYLEVNTLRLMGEKAKAAELLLQTNQRRQMLRPGNRELARIAARLEKQLNPAAPDASAPPAASSND
jgi:eukaryotic-like serine/threonine-protein kinase